MARMLAAAKSAEEDLGVASCFEVHVRREARWTIDCTATTAAEARAEAEDIARRTEVMAVKVVNERYNPRTEQSATRVVFKVEKPERKRSRGAIRLAAAPRVPRPQQPATNPTPVAAPTAAAPNEISPGEISKVSAPPTPPPPLPQRAVQGRAPASPASTWLLFAWASLVLALGASALFVFLLVLG